MIALTPGGRMLDDPYVDELAAEPAITLLCGRYEGFDERIVQHFASDTLSVGRYVLAGGELAAMVVCDAVLRKLPGALGHADSAVEESFSAALGGDPEYPHYTRPAEYRGWKVPDVLLSGHHEEIRNWRRARSRERGRAGGSGSTRDFGTHGPPSRGLRCSAPPPPVPMSTVIDNLERAQLRRVPNFQAGDRVKVHFQVIEGTRRRTQVFEGVVIKRQGHGVRETFTVRKQSFGVGVERTFPVHSPKIEKIEVAARGDVRRAKLYYLRDRVGKRARVRERRYIGPEEVVEPGLVSEATDAEGIRPTRSWTPAAPPTPRPRSRRRRPPRRRRRPPRPRPTAEAAPSPRPKRLPRPRPSPRPSREPEPEAEAGDAEAADEPA